MIKKIAVKKIMTTFAIEIKQQPMITIVETQEAFLAEVEDIWRDGDSLSEENGVIRYCNNCGCILSEHLVEFGQTIYY